MRYIICLLINVIIAVTFDWPEAFAVLFFALMAEGAVLSEMKVHDNMKFWNRFENAMKSPRFNVKRVYKDHTSKK